MACRSCGEPLAIEALACPRCHAIVHRERLAELQREAVDAEERRDRATARDRWRAVAALLPEGSRQHAEALRRAEASPKRGGSSMPKILAGLGAVGVLLFKMKGVLLLVASKAKLILLGLTKWKTLLSMVLSLGLYWSMWGWPFALGFVLSIYVHEMGHVSALRHYGIPASAPMFIPGVGAFVRLNAHPKNAIEDARIGLAGPLWGLLAAAACLAIFRTTDYGLFAALAHVGAWINLFNLLPVWQLDGGRGFAAFHRTHAAIATAGIGALFLATHDGIVLLMLLAGIYRVFKAPKDAPGDTTGLLYYLGLLAALGWIFLLEVPGVPGFRH